MERGRTFIRFHIDIGSLRNQVLQSPRLPKVIRQICLILYLIAWIVAILTICNETYQMFTGGSAEVRYAHGELFTNNKYALMGGRNGLLPY